jgi:hypothetical protein
MEDPAVGEAALDALRREAERLQADYARLVDDASAGDDDLSLPAPPGIGERAP